MGREYAGQRKADVFSSMFVINALATKKKKWHNAKLLTTISNE
jgi:hypothetical protein